MPADSLNANFSKTIESVLSGLGEEARELILKHIREKYGMDAEQILQYREEFANYLREIMGNSAETIVEKLDEAIPKAQCSRRDGRVAKPPSRLMVEKIPTGVFFIMCEHCLWCATLLKYMPRPRCYSCSKRIRDAVPISSGESFDVSMDEKRGITLSFW
ncbi:hypothetical protein [Nitrososphaera viennensis]|uniref:Uncharacterized protein n=2 Tax=Nitrososphaera viennensis TaxID=1034015 RepID=A0A060HGY4_9ARCH|nr:hypothetical protein [Nitrososphaera viennensis]AIC14828.1 hypothetical protein NVIE_006240 [Nitrososphaera viennensis EN76]UVS69780.1 hypothetical protein NWT39_03090 [Nitrososphaera viennensis]